MPTTEFLTARSIEDLLKLAGWTTQLSPAPQTLSQQQDADALRQNIRDALLRTDGGLQSGAPFTLLRSLRFAAELKKIAADQHRVFNILCDALRTDQGKSFIAPLSEISAWNSALESARALDDITDTGLYDLNLFTRETAVSGAATRLDQRGYKVTVSTYGPALEAKTVSAICKRIDHLVEHLGGRSVIEAVLAHLERNHGVYFESLLFGRRVEQVPKPRPPSTPWYYLYNLGLKHLSTKPTSKAPPRDFTEVQELARDMAAIFDCEHYSIFEQMNLSITHFDRSINERVVYDELFVFPQWQPSISTQLFKSWIASLRTVGCGAPISNWDAIEALGCFLLQKAAPARLLVAHSSELTVQSMEQGEAALLLRHLSAQSVNGSYLTPLDTAKRTGAYHPVFRYSTDFYALPPKGILGRALYERIYALMREAGEPDLENKLGKTLELLTAEALALTGKGADVVDKKYDGLGINDKKRTYQIDAARGNDRRLELYECKKKPLTNKAKQGNSLASALDFARGFLDPLDQINRHEAQLLRGGINFIDGTWLKLDDRDLYRIAITMTDHGSMRDPNFVAAMIRGLWGTKLNAVDTSTQNDADEATESMTNVVNGIVKLAALRNQTLDDFFPRYLHRIWWFGIDQLFFICKNAEDIDAILRPAQSMLFGSGDMMTEIHHAEKLGLIIRQNGRLAQRPLPQTADHVAPA